MVHVKDYPWKKKSKKIDILIQKDLYSKDLRDFAKTDEEDPTPGTLQSLHHLNETGIGTTQCHSRRKQSISKNTQKVPEIPTNIQAKSLQKAT